MSKSTLDRIDSALVAALQNNARMSNKELAAKVHLAPSSCHGRVRRLVSERADQDSDLRHQMVQVQELRRH